MQLIFERMAGGEGGDATLQMVYDELRAEGLQLREDDPNIEDRAWIEQVLDGVISHLSEIDQKISAASVNWPISRMSRVDLTILRLAVWELLYEDSVPDSVAVNEAVELARTYSEENSTRFINGVLGTIARGKADAES